MKYNVQLILPVTSYDTLWVEVEAEDAVSAQAAAKDKADENDLWAYAKTGCVHDYGDVEFGDIEQATE